MKTFDTFESVDGMKTYRKTATARAIKMDVEFRVNSLEGDYKQGKPGDYLMRGPDNELYICDGHIFDKTYVFVED